MLNFRQKTVRANISTTQHCWWYYQKTFNVNIMLSRMGIYVQWFSACNAIIFVRNCYTRFAPATWTTRCYKRKTFQQKRQRSHMSKAFRWVKKTYNILYTSSITKLGPTRAWALASIIVWLAERELEPSCIASANLVVTRYNEHNLRIWAHIVPYTNIYL